MERKAIIRWRVSARSQHSWDRTSCSCSSCNQPCEIGRYRWRWLARVHAWLHNRTGANPHAFITRLVIGTELVPEIMLPPGTPEFRIADGLLLEYEAGKGPHAGS